MARSVGIQWLNGRLECNLCWRWAGQIFYYRTNGIWSNKMLRNFYTTILFSSAKKKMKKINTIQFTVCFKLWGRLLELGNYSLNASHLCWTLHNNWICENKNDLSPYLLSLVPLLNNSQILCCTGYLTTFTNVCSRLKNYQPTLR